MPPLADFLQMSNTEWSRTNQGPDYLNSTLSWGLVYFLMSTKEGQDVLVQTIRKLRSGRRSALQILQMNYDGGLTALEADFRRFIETMPAKQVL